MIDNAGRNIDSPTMLVSRMRTLQVDRGGGLMYEDQRGAREGVLGYVTIAEGVAVGV